MLLLNDPDRMVLMRVDPKNNPAANSNHRVGWTFNQFLTANNAFDSRRLSTRVRIEIDGRESVSALLLMAHSIAQSRAINPANTRNRATLGTST